jgi:hypothetical protein
MTKSLRVKRKHSKTQFVYDDVIVGGEAIAKETGLTVHQVYHAAAHGYFKDAVVKFGPRRLLGFRSKLRAQFAGAES